MTTLKVIIVCLSLLMFAIHSSVDTNEVSNVMSVGNRVILEVGNEYRLYDTQNNTIHIEGSTHLFPGIGVFKPYHATAVTEHPKWPKANDMLLVLAKHSRNEYRYFIYRIVNETYKKVSDKSGLPKWGLNASGISYWTNEVDPFWGAISELNAITFYENVFISLKSSSANDSYSVWSKAVESDDRVGDWIASKCDSPNLMTNDVRSLFVMSASLYAFLRNANKSLRHITPVKFHRINGSIVLKFLENEMTDVNAFFGFEFPTYFSGSNVTESTNHKKVWSLWLIITLTVVVIAIVIAIGITIFLCCRGKNTDRREN